MKLLKSGITAYTVAVALLCAASSTVFAQHVAPSSPLLIAQATAQPATTNQAQRDRRTSTPMEMPRGAMRRRRGTTSKKANSEAVGHGKLYRQAAAKKDQTGRGKSPGGAQ